MGKQQMIEFVVTWCNDNRHGYDQASRWGPDADCSSLMYMAGMFAGYALPTSGTRYTGTMRQHFTAAGFSAAPFYSLAGLQPGDILLNERDHTEMCIAPGVFGGASINEHGGVVGGTPGDQTGKEIRITNAYVYHTGWNWVLSPPLDVVPKPRNAVTLWSFHGGDNQKWRIIPQIDGTVKLQSVANGAVLDVEGAVDANGTRAIWWPAKDEADTNQRWHIEPLYTGFEQMFYLRSALSGHRVLDVERASAENAARLILWPAHPKPSANQVFMTLPAGDGAVYIMPLNAPGYVLDANL